MIDDWIEIEDDQLLLQMMEEEQRAADGESPT